MGIIRSTGGIREAIDRSRASRAALTSSTMGPSCMPIVPSLWAAIKACGSLLSVARSWVWLTRRARSQLWAKASEATKSSIPLRTTVWMPWVAGPFKASSAALARGRVPSALIPSITSAMYCSRLTFWLIAAAA